MAVDDTYRGGGRWRWWRRRGGQTPESTSQVEILTRDGSTILTRGGSTVIARTS